VSNLPHNLVAALDSTPVASIIDRALTRMASCKTCVVYTIHLYICISHAFPMYHMSHNYRVLHKAHGMIYFLLAVCICMSLGCQTNTHVRIGGTFAEEKPLKKGTI